jgi:hypothetical protein
VRSGMRGVVTLEMTAEGEAGMGGAKTDHSVS